MSKDDKFPKTNDIADVLAQVIETFGGLEARLVPAAPVASQGPNWCARVDISGGFEGVVATSCSPALARRIALSCFGTDVATVSDETAREALGEFTHVIGGNIKSLISQLVEAPCQLQPPIVTSGAAAIAGAVVRDEFSFLCGNELLDIGLLEKRA